MKKFVHEIHRRSLWQVLGIYLVGSWFVLQVVDTMSGALRLPDWASPMALVLLIVGLPIVLATAFVQVEASPESNEEEIFEDGAPAEEAASAPAVFAPRQLLTWRNAIGGGFGAFLILFGFAGLYVVIQDRGRSFNPLNEDALGAATTTVTMEDSTGTLIEREIPSDEYRRSLALFAFENKTGDTTVNWLRFGLPEAVEVDLYQDMFIRFVGVSSSSMFRDLRDAGFDYGIGAPLPLKRQLAQDRHLDALLTGSILQADSAVVVETELYDATRGRLIERRTVRGGDVFEVADLVSVQLKQDLGIPGRQIEEAEDLPVSELATNSESAFRQYVVGNVRLASDDHAEAVEWYSGASQEDPSFALAHFGLVTTYTQTAEPEAASASMQATLEHLYRLPERLQLTLRTIDYRSFRLEPEKALKTARYRVELFPQDIGGRWMLAAIYRDRGEWEARIAELEAILDIDPTQYDAMRLIGDAHERQARFEEALSWYGRYAELFPNDYQSSLDMGDLHRRRGAHDRARDAYERALLVEPGEVNVLTRLARLESDLGDFAAAERWIAEAMSASRGPEDRTRVYDAADNVLYRQGRFREAIDNYVERVAAIGETGGPTAGLRAADTYAIWNADEVGRQDWAFRQLDSLRSSNTRPWDDIHGILYARALANAGDVQRARSELRRANEGIASRGLYGGYPEAVWTEGLILENEGDCRSAVESYRRAAALSPASWLNVGAELGRCQRKLGELDAAEATLQDILKITPGDAKTRVQLGLVYEEMGRQSDAIEQLEAAVNLWKDADPDYIPAREAEAKLGELVAGR